jgi:hypothetical protein
MQLFTNDRLVTRNRRFSRWMMFGGLGLSIAAVIITFSQPALIVLAFALILAGGIISQLGTAIHNRFGRSPRIDEVIDFSLKGLDDRHAIFHYLMSTNHALFTPAGVYAVLPRLEKGMISYQDQTWNHQPERGRFSFGAPRVRKLRSLEKEAQRESDKLQRYLRKNIPQFREIEVEPLALFLANDTQIQADNAPLLAVHRKKLKDVLRRQTGKKPLTHEDIQRLADYLSLG